MRAVHPQRPPRQGLSHTPSSTRLTRDKLIGLAKLGIIPCGQEFGINSQCDGKEEPAFVDKVPCSVFDDRGNKLDEVAVNPWSGKPYEPHDFPYFVYECWERTDSSD